MSQGGMPYLGFITHPAFDLGLGPFEYDAPDNYCWAPIRCPGRGEIAGSSGEGPRKRMRGGITRTCRAWNIAD